MPITRFKDEKEKEEYLKQIRQQQQANLEEANRRYQESQGKINEVFNNSKDNISNNSQSLWDQIKTTASNMLGNVGYGLGNGLIGFAQNERRNQTTGKSLDLFNKINVSSPMNVLDNTLGRLGKSIDSTLEYALKNNANYNNFKKAKENTENNILSKIDEKLQKQEDINNENIQKNVQETTNPIGQKLVEIAPSLGQMIPSAIPGIGTLYSVGSATDSYYDEAKSRGMNDEQASNYSQIMGIAEGLTEQIGVGKLVKGGKGIAKGTVKEAFKDFGIGVADNFIQEAVIEPISEGVTKATAGDEYLKNDYRTSEGWKNLGKDMLQSGIDGAITAGIMGGVSAGLGKSINIYNKLKNGQQPTANEYKEAFNEQREKGIDVDENVQNEFKNRINKSIQETKSKYMQSTDHNNISNQTNTQQGIANRLNEIVKNDKYLSQEDKQAMIDATNNLASKNQLDTDNTLDAINQIKQMSQLSQEQKDQLDAGKKYLSGRKEIYNKYRNVTDYDNSIVQQAKDTVAPNKQGKRTKEQWLDVAKYIGTNIADRPNSEIQKIAYKSWQEETPNNSATLNKQGQKYVKFMSDDWIDTIYDAVDKQRQKSGYVANNDTVNALDNLYNEYTNNQVLQNNNIQNNIDTSKMNLVDSAKAYNLNGNDETIQSINQKLNDRGISSRFDGNLFKDANGELSKNINALWRTTKDENGNTHREIVFNPYIDGNINEQKTMQQVTIHEMLHDMARDEKVKGDLFNLVLDKNKTRDGYSDARRNLEEMYSQVYDKNSENFKNLVDEEEVADTLAQKLGDQDFINSLNKEKPNVFKRIYSWIVDKLNKFTGNKNEKLYWEDVKNKFENAYKQDYQRETDLKTRFDIVIQGNKQYVKASRQVISGKNPLQWEEQVENYINEKIRNGEDVQVLAKDGDILSITGDTAGKAKFRNEIIDKNGKKRRLNNKEFMAKLRAETHIDELAQTSTHKNGPVQDTKNHSFAKDGWNYRTAYFEDINGSYYRITMSVGKNGQINTIYNIGKMQNWQKNRRHSISELKGSSGKTTSDRISSTNSIPTSYNNVNTTNNSSMQNNVNNTRFSIAGKKGMKNAIKQNTRNIHLEENYNMAVNMARKGLDNETIRQKTNWFQDKNGVWKFEFSDKDMKIRRNIKADSINRLDEILEHDTLFTVYPELENLKVVFKDTNKIDGNYNKNTKTITMSNDLIGHRAKTEIAIIHEIQHAIQDIEGFETGISSKLSKEMYYNNLGEIEADNTARRFIDEKYKQKDISNIPPESSKANPKHRKYDNYMKKRGIVDKAKDAVFKYLNKIGDNSESIKENYSKFEEQDNGLVDDGRFGLQRGTRENRQTESRRGDKRLTSLNESGAWQSFLENQIGSSGKGKTVQELRLPTKDNINNKKVDAYNILYQDNNQTSKTNLPISEGGKTRKHYKSIMQSSNTSPEAKAIAKELIGSDTYVPDSNEKQLATADNRIINNGADNESVTLATKVKNNDKITADDIAVGERLIEYYSKTGEKEKLQDVIQNVALAGTQAGQTVQAMSLINRQTPQGQAVYLSKVVDRMNKQIEKRTKGKGQQFDLTPEMLDKITNSSKENLEKNIDEVARELAKQVPKTTMEKIDSWRYFSMLANPRTHIRNIIGNFSMANVQSIKNKIAGGLESIAQRTGMIDQRTKTLKPASKEVKSFAKKDVENVLDRLNNESKFDTKNLIQQYQRTFKSNILENTLGKLYNLNSKALEAEDTFGLKNSYRKAMADYMTANKLTEKDLTAGTKEADTKLEKARKYAIEQAQEATFHQYSSLASLLNTLENKNKATRLLTGAIIPFKKTPINVAKTGIEYSPIGIVKSFTTDIAKLRNGDINVNQYIDNLSKGLTGTGITLAGYALAQAGILSIGGDDDDQKNQYYQEDRGNQAFSVKIGDKTYSLDWLSPTAIPLFVGAQLNENVKNAGEEQTTEDILENLSNSIDAMSSAMNPMIEMSMLSGIASTIKGFAQDDKKVIQNLITNSVKSYVNQFFPTLGGQIAKMVDDTERSTTSTKKNMFAKAVDSTGKQILNKIPFASKLLPAKTDVWGNEVKREPNKLYRALQQAVFPWTEKELKSTKVDNSISDLYERTGDNSVLPNTSINKDFTINSEKYRLTADEYANYKKQYGKTSYNLLNKLTNSSEYKNMTDEQKTKAISEIYSYANEKNKIDYANKNSIKDVKASTTYKTIEQIKHDGGNESDYFKYIGSTLGVDKQDEKIDVLSKMNISDKSKGAIYKSTFGKDDDVYNKVLSKNGIDINEYLKYKTQKFTSDKKDDGTVQGKTVTNSKKNKVYNYINNMKLSYENRLVLLGQQYKLGTQEREDLFNYINNTDISTTDKLKIYEKMQGFTVYKNGNVEY